jgi:hypothetical protein
MKSLNPASAATCLTHCALIRTRSMLCLTVRSTAGFPWAVKNASISAARSSLVNCKKESKPSFSKLRGMMSAEGC